MVTELQKLLDRTLDGLLNTYIFFDGNLMVTKCTEAGNWEKVTKVLDEAIIRQKMEKNNFAAKGTKWLGFHFFKTGVELLNWKIQGNTDQLKPKTFTKWRSFLKALNQIWFGLFQVCRKFDLRLDVC